MEIFQPAVDDSSGHREVAADASNFVLYELPSGKYEIHVVTNISAAYFFIYHQLSDEEVKSFRSQGMKFLMTLADKVRRNKGQD